MSSAYQAEALTPRISIVMCTYNGQRFLDEQLRSISQQTLPPFELVVCDDGSTDGTVAVLEKFSKDLPFQVRVYRNAVRLGSTQNFQRGIMLAEGSLIALCDQDDVWKASKLADLAKILDDSTVAGAFTDAELIEHTGRALEGSLWSQGHLPPRQQEEFRRDPVGLLLQQDVVTGATLIFRSDVRELYDQIPREWVHDGWLTWMMVLHRERIGRLVLSGERTICYRVHEGQQTGAAADRAGARSEPLRVRLEKARRLGHEHHRAAAQRLRLVLDHWRKNGGEERDAVTQRLYGTITLLEGRAALPTRSLPRLMRVIGMLPRYMRYGRGLVSAGRDVWA